MTNYPTPNDVIDPWFWWVNFVRTEIIPAHTLLWRIVPVKLCSVGIVNLYMHHQVLRMATLGIFLKCFSNGARTLCWLALRWNFLLLNMLWWVDDECQCNAKSGNGSFYELWTVIREYLNRRTVSAYIFQNMIRSFLGHQKFHKLSLNYQSKNWSSPN